jgi:hypothetical protein
VSEGLRTPSKFSLSRREMLVNQRGDFRRVGQRRHVSADGVTS